MERTFAIIKPDGIEKGVMGLVIKRIKEVGLEITKMKKVKLIKEHISKLYCESLKKFPQIKQGTIDYLTGAESILMIIEGEEAIKKIRQIRGTSNPATSPIGGIRKDFGGDQNMEELTPKGQVTKTVMHSSGNEKEVEEEIKLFFGEDIE